jgi:undecaprenyl-diphosphatase
MENLQTMAISNLVAFAAGMAAIGFMLRYLSRKDLKVFGGYRIALAVVVLLLFAFGVIG